MNSQRKALQNLRRLPHFADVRSLDLQDDEVFAACELTAVELRDAAPRKFKLREPVAGADGRPRHRH